MDKKYKREEVKLSSIIQSHLDDPDTQCLRLCSEIRRRKGKKGQLASFTPCDWCPVRYENIMVFMTRKRIHRLSCFNMAWVARRVAMGEILKKEEAIANALAEIALCLKAQGD